MTNKANKYLNVAKLFINEVFGENSASQSKELSEWIKTHKNVASDIYNWDNYVERKNKISRIDTEKEWANLKRKLNKETNVKRFDLGQVVKYAAAAIFLITVGLYYVTDNKQEVVQVAETQVIKENPNGVKSQIQLPDGTHVWLNAASRISYQENYSENARLITLEGEAFFEVVKDTKRPFRVTSGNVVTTALGTSFNINAYQVENIRDRKSVV